MTKWQAEFINHINQFDSMRLFTYIWQELSDFDRHTPRDEWKHREAVKMFHERMGWEPPLIDDHTSAN